jgi:hypothetical protein
MPKVSRTEYASTSSNENGGGVRQNGKEPLDFYPIRFG